MPALLFLMMRRTKAMTPGITQVSGQSTDESATQQENANGDLPENALNVWLQAAENVGGLVVDYAAEAVSARWIKVAHPGKKVQAGVPPQCWMEHVLEVTFPSTAGHSVSFLQRPKNVNSFKESIASIVGFQVKYTILLNMKADDPYSEVCDEIYGLLNRKRSYYGCAEESPLSNALGVEEDGIEPWRYQLVRIKEKCRRLRGEAGNQDTLIIETLYDIAGHAAVGIACIHAKKGKKNEL